MREERAVFVRKGLIGTCALLALVLLVSFYSIVNGAVDRAAQRRLAASGDGTPAGDGAAQRHARPGVARSRRQLTLPDLRQVATPAPP